MSTDDTGSCRETFCTFRLYPGHIAPATVTEQLGIEPSDVQHEGEVRGSRQLKLNGWFLSSRGNVESVDVRRHLDWLLDQLEMAKTPLEELRTSGARMDVSCYWLSAHGQGGPMLSPPQTRRLGDLDLDCWFDIYFAED